jgi:hypothetical protein
MPHVEPTSFGIVESEATGGAQMASNLVKGPTHPYPVAGISQQAHGGPDTNGVLSSGGHAA